MKNDELIMSAYGSHNAAVAMYYKGQYYVVEVERWLNHKNVGLNSYLPCRNPQLVFDQISEWLLSKTDRSDVDVFISDYFNLTPKFHIKRQLGVLHHDAHAAAFYQSPYQEALVFTFDGGGDSAYFNVYKASRDNGLELIDKFNQDLGFPYMILSDYLADIKKESLSIGNLVYAGKLMGLCSYGDVIDEWLPHFDAFYDKFNYFGNAYIGGAEAKFKAITELMTNIGLEKFNYSTSRFEGKFAWDIAATTQRAFENQFFKYATKYLNEYKDLPIVLSGGCALNVLLNTKLLEMRNGLVFVPPNTNDCGIAVGGILWYQKPDAQVDLTYSGLPMMDENDLSMHLEDRALCVIENTTVKEVAAFISDGHIVGILQGNSEHGSRALGNRSIFCNPIAGMKDMLNNKVKHREWYRPFAPLVRQENVGKYFDFSGTDSRHMTFVANVKDEWRTKLPAITHEDGTGRLQTVTRNQNKFVYELLGEFEELAGHGVLLNTSFNDNGKPILSRYSDAFKILKTTELDAVYCVDHNILVLKTADESKFKKTIHTNQLSPLSQESTLHVLAFSDNIDTINSVYIPFILQLSKSEKHITILCESAHMEVFKSNCNNHNIHLFEVSNKMHYYSNRLEMGYKKQTSLNKNSTYFYSTVVNPLWVKESITENFYNTNYHTILDLDLAIKTKLFDSIPNASIINIINSFVKNDEHILMYSDLIKGDLFDDEFLTSLFKTTTTVYPNNSIVHANLENILWYTNNYEGVFLWYIDQEMIDSPKDYALISYMDCPYRYTLIGQT